MCALKDPFLPELQSSGIYKLKGKDCIRPLLGQTKIQALNAKAISHGHRGSCLTPKILHREPVFAKRLIIEILHIHDEPNTVNKKNKNKKKQKTLTTSMVECSNFKVIANPKCLIWNSRGRTTIKAGYLLLLLLLTLIFLSVSYNFRYIWIWNKDCKSFCKLSFCLF